MNLGIMTKSIREIWALTLLCALGAFIFEAIVSYVFWTYQEELTGDLLKIEFIRNLIESLIGSELGDQLDPRALDAMAWVHPLILSIVWAYEITVLTRMPAGEIDRGTIDVLLALPVSRWRIYGSETALWLLGGAVVLAAAVLGNYLGHLLVPPEARPELTHSLSVALNFYGIYLAVGAITLFMSALSDRRGRAVAAILTFVFASFLWNFLGQYWEPADTYAFLSLLNYYKPAPILRDGAVPLTDMAVLLSVATVFWVAGCITFVRRDVCTV